MPHVEESSVQAEVKVTVPDHGIVHVPAAERVLGRRDAVEHPALDQQATVNNQQAGSLIEQVEDPDREHDGATSRPDLPTRAAPRASSRGPLRPAPGS